MEMAQRHENEKVHDDEKVHDLELGNAKEQERILTLAMQLLEQKNNVHHEKRPQTPTPADGSTGSGSLSGIASNSRGHDPHRYKCCCCEMDGPVINYTGKLTIGLSVLLFCFIQIHRSSEDFAAYMTLISAVLGVFISTPKMKRNTGNN